MAAGLDIAKAHYELCGGGTGVSLVRSEVAGRGRPSLHQQRCDRFSSLYLLANIPWLTIVGWQT
jgi:hypothetical protein